MMRPFQKSVPEEMGGVQQLKGHLSWLCVRLCNTAETKGEIWALTGAVWASSQPHTHITSLLLSLMLVCPHTESVHGEKYPNKTKEKSVFLC